MEQTPQENELALYEKPVGEHLQELRKRLLWCLVFVLVAFFGIVTNCSEQLVELISSPVKAQGIHFIYVGLAEALVAQLKVSFIAAVVVASPFVIWHIWSFIKPALYDNEKKYVWYNAFGYGVVFLSAITFFVYVGQGIATPMLSISDYVSFLFGFVIPFGLVFEMPIICYVLSRLGLVTVQTMVAMRKYVVLVIFVVAAFLTPPDVLSQVLMALPMLVLYEVGILVVKLTVKNKEQNQA
ncbi:MAG: twin-arginine translocase subunit TatC [Acidaminococcaceae bacterium]|nr:twin-arginine translocase subunit TatC [Acidaminococcaceae bacterium]